MNRKISPRHVALAAFLVLAAGGVSAQGSATPAMAASSGMSASGHGAVPAADHSFAVTAAKGGMAEVALGKLAQQRAGSDGVKQFAAHMVDDHSKANAELTDLAGAKHITLPAAPPKDPTAKKLQALSGTAFDKAYMTAMLDDHKKTIALFQKEASSGKDPELKAFAAKTLPTLKEHLDMVNQTRTAVMAAK